MLTRQPITIAFLTLVFVSPAIAEIYRWTDENGRVHFADRAPSRNRLRRLRARPALRQGANR